MLHKKYNILKLYKDVYKRQEKDTVVPIKSDKIFYNALKDQYDFTDRLNMVTFDRLNHYVTQAYINELISWFNKYL